jgi:predicted RNase H-like HicB family nuclease
MSDIQAGRFMSETKHYVYVIEEAEDGIYWVYVPDLPGCATFETSPDRIEGNFREAAQLCLNYYRDRGLTTPTPQARVGTVTVA